MTMKLTIEGEDPLTAARERAEKVMPEFAAVDCKLLKTACAVEVRIEKKEGV